MAAARDRGVFFRTVRGGAQNIGTTANELDTFDEEGASDASSVDVVCHPAAPPSTRLQRRGQG